MSRRRQSHVLEPITNREETVGASGGRKRKAGNGNYEEATVLGGGHHTTIQSLVQPEQSETSSSTCGVPGQQFMPEMYKEQENFLSESGLQKEQVMRQQPLKRTKAIDPIRLKDERLDLQCEWDMCRAVFTVMDRFMEHMDTHIIQVDVQTNMDDSETFGCLWVECGFETGHYKEVMRHIYFHAFHTKIKCIGANLLMRMDIQGCTLDALGRNMIPELPDTLQCHWFECGFVFDNAQLFYWHVQSHAEANPVGNKVKGGVKCEWGDCRGRFRSLYKLRDHMRTHTQEKVAGCPTCGGLFSNRTKFFDHCKRQTPLELQEYQCSHCSKYFSSERLLRDHMRHHINHYKCPYCDMTCPTPSGLQNHIKYRHSQAKHFHCEYCEYRAKTQYDLTRHMNTHFANMVYRCDVEGCNYEARTLPSLNYHIRKIHEGVDEPLYCCHICDKRFLRGAYLTKHLIKKHKFRWPSGHSRFRYKTDSDGYSRLQTVRYESIELTQELIENATEDEESILGTSQVMVTDHETEPSSGGGDVMNLSSNGQPGGNILVTIQELDTEGNILNSEVVPLQQVMDSNESLLQPDKFASVEPDIVSLQQHSNADAPS